ncbi:MAG: hypothetical protein Q4G68_10425 [Planctomycetia bacterium]|nr:hypothetical protein [Planctomycetia bacterium]
MNGLPLLSFTKYLSFFELCIKGSLTSWLPRLLLLVAFFVNVHSVLSEESLRCFLYLNEGSSIAVDSLALSPYDDKEGALDSKNVGRFLCSGQLSAPGTTLITDEGSMCAFVRWPLPVVAVRVSTTTEDVQVDSAWRTLVAEDGKSDAIVLSSGGELETFEGTLHKVHEGKVEFVPLGEEGMKISLGKIYGLVFKKEEANRATSVPAARWRLELTDGSLLMSLEEPASDGETIAWRLACGIKGHIARASLVRCEQEASGEERSSEGVKSRSIIPLLELTPQEGLPATLNATGSEVLQDLWQHVSDDI